MAAQQQRAQAVAMPRLSINPVNAMRGRGRPHTVTNKSPVGTVLRGSSTSMRPILPTGMVLSNNYSMAPTQNASMMQQVSTFLKHLCHILLSLTLAFLLDLDGKWRRKCVNFPSSKALLSLERVFFFV